MSQQIVAMLGIGTLSEKEGGREGGREGREEKRGERREGQEGERWGKRDGGRELSSLKNNLLPSQQ